MTRVKRVESACAYFHACTRRAHEVGDVPVTSSTEAIGDRGKDKLGQMMQDAVIRATVRPEPGVVGFLACTYLAIVARGVSADRKITRVRGHEGGLGGKKKRKKEVRTGWLVLPR